MEIFSLMLKRHINNHPRFQYHFGCKPIKLVHVCFANDLLVMCHGDSYSVRVIKSALDEFSACSGLLPNNPKSTVFFGSLSEEEKSEILNVIPFTTGKLPVRYLGVPLIAKRLSVKDCGCLLDKIKSKIRNYKNRCLSYAGRLQLIAVVLESILNQGESAKGKAKVAWNDVCRPKNQAEITIRILAFAASIYNIWQERNGRIFRESKRSCDEVFKSMMEMIKNKLLGITANDSLAVRDIERRWAITCKRIQY
ncbi:hypothetical protein Tco_0874045 [Tanacetum coccineum]|uniref:Reverse transcriptase domain-containing protein n=1 Tax=Tanacetum coccineum TaxID=301880 RepID=A0ABQ5BR71_9ASTR